LEERVVAALLEARDVSFAYRGGEPVLHNVSFTVDEGANLGLVGESGAGKTTLLRILLGLSVPTSGEIFAEGRPFDARNRAQLRVFRRLTQTVFQDPYSSLDPRQSIGRIIAEPLRALGLARTNADALPRVEAALESVGLPTDSTTRYPHEFSGGQRQRIAIARAIVANPRVLLADEPASALDLTTRVKVIDLLAELGREGLPGRDPMTVVVVTHDLGVVSTLCQRVVVLQRGRIVEQGDRASVLRDPQHPYTRRLLESVPRLPVG
jgi:ABC-type glutathione transport system ATPase component